MVVPTSFRAGQIPPRIAWLGDAFVEELALARGQISGLAQLLADAPPDAAPPALAILAAHGPASWTLADAVAVSRRWPLTPLVSVVTTLADGRRRSGPWLPGIEEIPWHDLPGRLAWWLRELADDRAGGLGMPATARREERHADAAARVRALLAASGPPPRVCVAGGCRVATEGIAELLAAAGFAVAGRIRGRPPLDDDAELVVWDTQSMAAGDLAWLAIMAAHRPRLGTVVLESFPRGETARAALRAGAGAMLGRPAGIEALAGTLLWLKSRGRTAIGADGGDR